VFDEFDHYTSSAPWCLTFRLVVVGILVLVAVVPLLLGCFPEDGLDDDDDKYVVIPAGAADVADVISEVAWRRLDMGAVVVALAVKYLVGPAVAVTAAGGDFLRAGGLQS